MHRAECVWPASPQSVRNARHFVQQQLEEWGAAALVWPAITVVSELATNAVLHARTDFGVQIELAGSQLNVRVSDKSPAMPVRRRYESSAATGRGLELLEALAADWGVTATDDGKVVWCTVQAADDRDGEPTGDATIAPVEHLADSRQTTGTGEAERASFARAA